MDSTDILTYNIFTFNRYGNNGDSPNMTAQGLPASLPSPNLPTSVPMLPGGDIALNATYGDPLNYIATAVEQGTPGNGAVKPALADQLEQPGLWGTVAAALFGGALGTSTANAASITTTSASGVKTTAMNSIAK